MERLAIPVPSFRLLRRILIGVTTHIEEEVARKRRGSSAAGGARPSSARRADHQQACGVEAPASAKQTTRVAFAKAVDVHDPTLDLGLLWAVDWTTTTDSGAAKKCGGGGRKGAAPRSTSEHDRKAAIV